MGYVIAGILVLLIVGGIVTFLVMSATKKSEPSAATDDDDQGLPTPFAADDAPAGDTTEHAGEQSGGETTGGQDADDPSRTGTGLPTGGADNVPAGGEPQAPEPDRRFQRDPVGGEAEARPFTQEGTDR